MKKFLSIFLLLFISACASIPKEAPELSQHLGVELQELENAHLNLVKSFFQQEKQKVRKFVDEKWLPLYATNFFEEPAIENVWQQVVVSGNKEDRLQFIVKTAPKLQQQINLKYQELITPLNQLELELTTSIRAKYNNAKSINQSLTSYLYSAADVAENRQRYLDMVGVSEEGNNQLIHETEQITAQLLKGAETVEEAEEKIRLFTEKMEELLAKL
ncbi:hypothetical protein [Mesonia aquimarina]|uniref:hypothetical protein n=1 Tax=Mesonia aquimarina TaxID=1504967 RepID=UPI0013CE5EF7|nr:hypothetical protein [Mesonia aquimarina]